MKRLFIPILAIAGLIIFIGIFFVQKKAQPLDNYIPDRSATTTNSDLSLLLQTPKPRQTITGPLVIKGQVPKSWTFESQFQLRLLDDSRKIILADQVPVEWDDGNTDLLLDFIQSYNYPTRSKSGFLVLLNDNPSGLPENEKSIEIPVKFSSPAVGTHYLFQPGTGNSAIDNQCEVVLPQPVNTGITQTPIKDTLNRLAKSMHPDFYVKNLNLSNGLLTIEFPVINGFTTGGSCAQGIHSLQVEKTALQFPQVKRIKIVPETIFQP